MKKFKSILCLILTVVLISSQFAVVGAATKFSDVDSEKSSFSEAIYTLTDFGVLKGDAGSDTFRPKANISREEFSVIVDRIMGMGDLNVTVTDYIFTDVTPETCADWSIKATKIAYDLGIISGMGDGTFQPKANVTYEQAVKMLVCALGYENVAVAYGGWPDGYMAVAREKGLTKKCEMTQTLPATREVIAQLVYNSLDVDLMLAVTTGDNIKYIVEPGQTILTQKLRFAESTGLVYGDANSSLEKLGGYTDGYVAIRKSGETNNAKYLKGSLDTSSYLGKSVKYYYTTTASGEDQIVAIRETSSNYEMSIESDDLVSISDTSATYYTDEDQSDTETIQIDNAKIVFNGQYAEGEATSLSALASEIISGDGTLKFIDNNGDSAYDVVVIDLISIFSVEAVDAANNRIYAKYPRGNVLNLNVSANNKVNITKNNAKVTFSAIKVDDVLLVKESKNNQKSYNIEIITNTKSGVLTGISGDNTVIEINGQEYDVSNYLVNIYANDSELIPSTDDRVTAYFDKNGKVIEISSTGTVSNTTYGYIYQSGSDSRNQYIVLKMFTSDGRLLDAKVNTKVKINDIEYTYEGADSDQATTIIDKLEKDQLVEFTTNSSGYVNNVILADSSKTDTAKYLIPFEIDESKVYSSSAKTLGNKVTLNNNTKVMMIPTNPIADSDEFSVGNHTELNDGSTYTYSAYDCTETGVANIILVFGFTESAAQSTLAIVNTVSNLAQGYTASAYVDGNLDTLYPDDVDNEVLKNFKRGDVIKLSLNSAGKVRDAELVFSPRSIPVEGRMEEKPAFTDATYDLSTYRYFATGTNYNTITAEYLTIFGTAYARDTERATVSLYDIVVTPGENGDNTYTLDDTEDYYPVTFAPSTQFYVIDTSLSFTAQNYLTRGLYNDIAGFKSANSGATRIFAYAKEGETQFVIVLRETR